MQQIWDALEVEVDRRKLPERTLFALADAAIGLRVRNATYRPVAEVRDNPASRDFKSLVASGLLVAGGERRGRFYVASEQLLMIHERTRETPRAEDDPFLDPPEG